MNSTLNPVKKQLVWTVGVISPRGEAARWQPLLERLLSDADPVVRDYTAFALARLGVPRGAELSLAALLDHNRKPITRGRAALALADGKFKAYAPQLQQILQEKPPCDLANRVQRAIDRMTTAR
jgi:HEAT repeat protein